MKWRMTKSCRPLRGLDAYLRHIPGVPLTLHPRLYSAARIRGLRTRQNAGKDKAPCFRLLRQAQIEAFKTRYQKRRPVDRRSAADRPV